MKLSLQTRILLFTLVVLTLTIAGNTWFAVESFRKTYREAILRRGEALADGLATQVKGVLDLGLTLQEINGLSERCRELVEKDPEIGYCVVEDETGRVLFNSAPPFPRTTGAQFLKNFSPGINLLESESLGQVYDLAIPLYDFDERLVGRVRVGFGNEVLDRLVRNHLYRALIVLGGGFAAMFFLIVFFARRDLIGPIRKLSGMAGEISAGNFRPEPPLMRTRELAALAEALDEMACSLRERDEEIRRNCREVEQANLELQTSYQHLETLSSELGRSREMYRSLMDDASDAILVCNEDDTIILVNKAAEEFFGQAKKQVEGSNYFLFLKTLSCDSIDCQMDRFRRVRPGSSAESEIRFLRPTDDKALVGWAVMSAVIGRDRRRLVQIVVRDATREEEVRQGLEQATRELDRLNQMKNTFLGLASHELKTPLTIIMGYLELLETEFAGQMDENVEDLLQQINKAAERLTVIVRDMLDVSSLDSRTIDLVSQEVDAASLVRQVADQARPHVLQRRQTLTVELADALPIIRCDLDRMVQALGNVLGNAIKFTPDGGEITIRARPVQRARMPEKFSRDSNGDRCRLAGDLYPYLEISVADQGIGIARDDQETIFEKFYEIGEIEGHSSGKVAFRSRGAGLGLTIVKGVVAIHGGAVWAESPGHDPETMPGSVFYILLPAVESPAAGGEESP
ncbi:MAG TPA: ATP-binding protein [Desulfuromonadales bacterium]|nr:ATP-binding protein [Desulfuromonadales bacterium]